MLSPVRNLLQCLVIEGHEDVYKSVRGHSPKLDIVIQRKTLYGLTFADHSWTPSCGSGESPLGGLRSSHLD